MLKLLGIALVFSLVTLGGARQIAKEQKSDSQSSNWLDLTAQEDVFDTYVSDLAKMEQSFRGEELRNAEFMDNVAYMASQRLFAAREMLRMYDNIPCKADRRGGVLGVLLNVLTHYSVAMDLDSNRVTFLLPLVKTPALAQIGLNMKRDLTANKNKLEAIRASLSKDPSK